MIAVIILFCIVIQYFILIFSVYARNYPLLAVLYITHNFFYDFLFINASYVLPETLVNVLKPLNEYFFIYLLFLLLGSIRKSANLKLTKVDKLTLYYFILPSIIFLLMFIGDTIDEPSQTVQGLRTYLLPIAIPYLMYKLNFFKGVKPKTVTNSIIYLSLIAVTFGIYQRNTFNGHVESLWFADFFKKMKEDPVASAPFDFIRNDVLRTTSFFVSPIIYSIEIAISVLLLMGNIYKQKNILLKLLFSIIMLYLIYGLVIAETRVGLVVCLIGVSVMLISKFFKKSYAYYILYTVPISCIVITVITLVFGYSDELSALGRLAQYQSFFKYFNWYGSGFSNENVLTHFDTFYMSLAILFGIGAIFPLRFFLAINKHLFNIFKNAAGAHRAFALSVLAIALAFVYVYAFQFTAGAFPFKLMYFLCFVLLSYDISYERKAFNSVGSLQIKHKQLPNY